MPNTITGYDDYLIDHLNDSLARATSIRIIVAFLMESGVRLIIGALAEAARRGIPIKILTGTYMSITEPSAVYHILNQLGQAVEIRFFTDSVRSFHPKAYIIDSGDDGEVFIGSSNLSKSALTSGVEWNYRLRRSQAPEDYDEFAATFDSLFAHCAAPVTEAALKAYAVSWKKPVYSRIESPWLLPRQEKPEPFGAQIEALYYLDRARAEGLTKGLVIAATGATSQ